jgi:hypothetical protein
MGVFQDLAEVVNRCPYNLTIRFDGQEMTLVPGKNFIPTQTVQYALNQNPLMGSQDPDNPTMSGAEYLIGLPNKANKYPCEPLTTEQLQLQKSRPSRFNHEELMEPNLAPGERIAVKGRKVVSNFEAKQGATILTEEFGVSSTD